MNRRRKKSFPVFLWHRRLGLVAMFFIIILSVTGIALNHTESLALDENMIQSDWLMDWYGLNPQQSPRSFGAGPHLITQWENQLFFDQQTLLSSEQKLQGAVFFNSMIVIALQQNIILLSSSGEIIERMPVAADIGNLIAIGVSDNHLMVNNDRDEMFQADSQIINWQPVSTQNIDWSAAETTPDALQQILKTEYRGEGLSLERILLDLHSGRLFSERWGIYIMDASALILLWLGGSGLWVWMSRKRKMKTKRHYRKHHAQ